jgi:hypothetical protein
MPQLGESVQNSTRMFRIHNKNSGECGLAGWPATLSADSSQMPRHGLRWAGVEFSVSSVTMRRRLSEPFDDVTVYLVLNDHGQFGIAFDETDPAQADRETIIRNFLTGQYGNALRVVAFNTAEGWS